ncbi:MAG TPA: hypothetical protein VIS76_13040, partial [Pseudomonadales bacterium]
MFRIATIYVVAGWLSIQAADIILEAFESPAWIMQAFLILVVAGLPVTLTAIWLVERAKQSRPSSPLVPLVTIGAALVLSLGAYRYFSGNQSGPGTESPPAQPVRVSNPVL